MMNMSRSYEPNPDVEYAISALEEHCEDELQLNEAYELLLNGEEYSDDQDMQLSTFIVQQIFEACEEHEGETSYKIMCAVGRRLRSSKAQLTGLIKRAFIDNR